LCGSIFVPLQNEMFYDLCGALGFIFSAFVSLYYPSLLDKFNHGILLPSIFSFAKRQLLLTAALGIWSTRLGTFLVNRALKSGGDRRFDEIKKSPGRFFYYWIAQATWNFVVGLPVYLANIVPPGEQRKLNLIDYAGFGLYAVSLLVEITADRQKSNWRKAKKQGKHNEKFITRGLWSISRHPNYVGEIGLWTGIWALSFTSLRTNYAFYTPGVALVSPVLTYLLLSRVSGVPPLERMAEQEWGNDPAWKLYKQRTPVLFPWMRSTA